MFPNDGVCLEVIMQIRYGDLKVCPKCKKKTITPIIKDNVNIGTEINTDEFLSYRSLEKEGLLPRLCKTCHSRICERRLPYPID